MSYDDNEDLLDEEKGVNSNMDNEDDLLDLDDPMDLDPLDGDFSEDEEEYEDPDNDYH